MMSRDIRIALNICTYHRKEYVLNNVEKLLTSKFFDCCETEYFGRLHIFVIDNGSELNPINDEHVHVFHNTNVGGSGGFQRGLVEIRRSEIDFTHVIFMDDDVRFDLSSFYILYDFLKTVGQEDEDRPVAGRMFCLDRPEIQYTAAEIWNGGNIGHVEFLRNVEQTNYEYGKVDFHCGGQYGGWWFCCFPMSFAKNNDIIPFFIHCDDVEYGLRCGKEPIIIEGVHVWHETFEKRLTPMIQYYDTRNPLFVNELYGFLPSPKIIYENWWRTITKYHIEQNWQMEYLMIRALGDFLKGVEWLSRIDSGKYHNWLSRQKSNKLRNAIAWRLVHYRFVRKYHI